MKMVSIFHTIGIGSIGPSLASNLLDIGVTLSTERRSYMNTFLMVA